MAAANFGDLAGQKQPLNSIGQAVPLLVGVVTIPFIVRGLGRSALVRRI